MKMILACSMGMSTSLLVEKLKEEAGKRNLTMDIEAIAYDKMDLYADSTDILLLGPQVRYLLAKFKTQYGDRVKVIEAMNMSDYALLNAAKILDEAMSKYQEK
ncbi:MAG: PTS sugar transporter subunit IIB [Lachnospiraceae bacterium]|nr:PTS sugar transporter subunit IIB [Lachnospiraceae bacterium]